MPKIYTKKGDYGKSSTFEKKSIYKFDTVFEVLGKVDIVIVELGMLKVFVKDTDFPVEDLERIQKSLMQISAVLATGKYDPETIKDGTRDLEGEIDRIDKYLPKLTAFIIPGKNVAESQASKCRVYTRSLEREFWKFFITENKYEEIGTYINRLSDYFFILERYLSDSDTSYKISRDTTRELLR